LIENETWDEIFEIPKEKLITSKWVFTVKYNGDEEFPKARLVARGFQDKNFYTLEETYSPVMNPTVFRWILSIAVKFDYAIFAIDVKTAFLYGDLSIPVYMQVPKGYKICHENTRALCLKKSLYGLKVSSKNWFLRFSEALLDLGFSRFLPDQCVFFRRNENDIIILCIYVDDCMLVTSNIADAEEIIEKLSCVFRLKVMRKPKIFLGVEFSRAGGCLRLHQKSYITKLCSRFSINDQKYSTPMETRLKLNKTGIPREEPGLRAILGALLFVARNSRPDIMFAVNYLSRFQSEGRPEIMKYAKRILAYLNNTISFSLVFDCSNDLPLHSYVDASFADASDSKYESTTGNLIFNYGNLISWSTRKQNRTSTSTSEAEYVALNDTVREIIFLREMNRQICDITSVAKIFEDNAQALRYAQGTETTTSRFLLTKEHAIRESVEREEVSIEKVSGECQLADIMTKALNRANFERLRNEILSEA
jgi:hypothetical protein